MRLRAVVAYDGTAYQGWQSQAGGATIQDTIERALAVVLRHPVRIAAAGRTDAGVHARGQVIAFDTSADLSATGDRASTAGDRPIAVVLRSINAVLPADVALLELAPAPPDFDPRRHATARAYRYRIWNAETRSPFEMRTAWHVRDRLDAGAMDEAASALVGEHDFSSFQGADHVPRSAERAVARSSVERRDDLVIYDIEANSFARHMVRNIVGALVEVGRGERPASTVATLLAARDRRLAPPPAPPQGLFLEWVRY